MRCPQCQRENRDGAKFCSACRAKLDLSCPSCNTVNELGAAFCDHCGTALTTKPRAKRGKGERAKRKTAADAGLRTPDARPASYTPRHLAERILTEHAAMEARGAADGERKTITALFADIKGSMALIEALDPEDARQVIDPALQLMMDAVHRYEGYVVQSTGDGIFAFFGAPIAHEDHPQRALYAALRMQDEIGKYADTLRAAGRSPIEIRVGVNTGEVVLRSIRKDEPAVQSLKQFILAKTEGNPFFMEEIVQALVEQGVLERSLSGGAGLRLAPGVNFTDLRVPLTVQAVLASRIDRLPPEEKALLQMLSVIGKEFPSSLLKHVVHQPEAELQRSLSRLQTAEFIYEQLAFPEVEYTFKHALTQEVAYNSLLIERRKGLHERTAQAIEALFHSQLEDHYGDLAYHYGRSGNTQKAVEYLGLAGRQAAQRSANTEAISHLTTALELLKTLPETSQRAQHELTVLMALGSSLRASKGFAAPEVEMVYARAQDLCEQIGDISQRFSALRGLWGIYFARRQSQMTRESDEPCAPMAATGQERRGPTDVGRHLRLVH